MPTLTKAGRGITPFAGRGTDSEPSAGFTQQWQRGSATGTDWQNIPGATDLQYSPTDYDIGHRIRCRVTVTNSAGSTTVYSEPTEIISATSEGNQDWQWSVDYAGGDTREWDVVEDSMLFADTDALARGSLAVVSDFDGMAKAGEITLPASGNSEQARAAKGRMGRRPGIGATDYYWISLYFPTPWNPGEVVVLEPNWQNLADPPIQLVALSDRVLLRIRAGAVTWDADGNPIYEFDSDNPGPSLEAISAADFTTDAWHDLLLAITWATDATGSVTVSHRLTGAPNFTQTTAPTGIPTFQWGFSGAAGNWAADGTDGDGVAHTTYDKAGGYADYGASSLTLYHALLRRGTTIGVGSEKTGGAVTQLYASGLNSSRMSQGVASSPRVGSGVDVATYSRRGRGISVRSGYAPAPPSLWYGVNVISNGAFSNGSTNWAGAVPGGWGSDWTSEGNGIGQVRQLTISSGSAKVYTGDGSQIVEPTDPLLSRGLVYTGSEWQPQDGEWWVFEFDWRQIGELYTNNPPWGITTPPDGNGFVDVRLGYGGRSEGPGWISFPNYGATGAWTHAWYTFAIDRTVAYWQFAIVGFIYVTTDPPQPPYTPYGFAFEVDNVKFYRTF